MKVLYLLILSLLFSFSGISQDKNDYAQKIIGNWMKDYIDMKDGSRIDDPSIDEITATMLIFKKNNIAVVIQGKDAASTPFEIFGDTLLVGSTVMYRIEKLTNYEFVFTQILENVPDYQLRRYHYLATKENSSDYFTRRFIKSNLKIQANGDSVYAFSKYIFPKFKANTVASRAFVFNTFEDVYEQSYDLIESTFDFPEKKKGFFKVSFVISKKGILKDISIKESSDSSYNAQLQLAILQTRKFWLPADIDGKAVDVLFNYEFNYSDEQNEINDDNYFDPAVYASLIARGDRQIEKMNYIKAIKLYTKCILMKDDAYDALYKRADAYFKLNVPKNACSDWNYLATKGLKKAEDLFIKNCIKR
ncbi:hypothetical protein [Arcicella rosea]|uniref:TonB protein C-terminal n=1 Tax=Arcicella rosea TaxID=502909 RepID=A0A841EQJ2_9BACT|nr:hypothetical protein [Arcicella rosea]MBB6005186.1 hypothetical protein [Arcicella rosea]